MNRPRKKDRHLPRCVYQKHGAFWHVKRGKWTKIGETLVEALEAYARLYETPQGGMDALIDEAFEFMKPSLSQATIRQYEQAARKLKKVFAEFAPDQVKQKHAAKLKVSMAKTPNMANRVLSFARKVYEYALEHEKVDENPFVGIRRYPEAQRERLVSADEYARVYAECNPRLQVIADLLRLTGQRVVAVLKIRRSDLTEEGIRFPQFKTETKRVVRWTTELREVVERAKTLYGNIRALTLLHNRRGKAPDYRTIHDQWFAACKRAGVEDAHLQDLRAVAATEAEKQGKNPTKLLGHTTPSNTRRYLRSREEPVVDGPSFRRQIDKPTK